MGLEDKGPRFPLVLRDINDLIELDDPEDVGQYLTYWNEDGFDDPDCEIRDSLGRRLRVIVLGAEMVLCHVIPETCDRSDISIRQSRISGSTFYFECVGGLGFRAIRQEDQHLEALPQQWTLPLGECPDDSVAHTMTFPDFNRAWCEIRDPSRRKPALRA